MGLLFEMLKMPPGGIFVPWKGIFRWIWQKKLKAHSNMQKIMTSWTFIIASSYISKLGLKSVAYFSNISKSVNNAQKCLFVALKNDNMPFRGINMPFEGIFGVLEMSSHVGVPEMKVFWPQVLPMVFLPTEFYFKTATNDFWEIGGH